MGKWHYSLSFVLVAAFGLIGFQWGCPRSVMAMPGEDAQVLASGPIHEAFAEVVTLDPEPGIIAPKAPPEMIEEVPPDQKPEGEVQWIPGYWAWDDERDDYIWVSGIWRVPPPKRAWVPGYWNPVGNGYQWTPGYWAEAADKEAVYMPEPPETVEVGPSSSPPSENYVWIPGCWLWQHGRYAWRPGYWAAAHQDWVWVPSYYSWTPRGYIFVGGYWDYTVIHRGVLFAPVYFPPRVHLGATFLFSPAFIINLSIFDDDLFLRPRYAHYYFGDYYDPVYYRMGIFPWFSLHARRVVFDPIFTYQRWHHRHDRRWERNLETRFQERREHAELRPPKRYSSRVGSNLEDRSADRQRQRYIMPVDRIRNDQAAHLSLSSPQRKGTRNIHSSGERSAHLSGGAPEQRIESRQSGRIPSDKSGTDQRGHFQIPDYRPIHSQYGSTLHPARSAGGTTTQSKRGTAGKKT